LPKLENSLKDITIVCTQCNLEYKCFEWQLRKYKVWTFGFAQRIFKSKQGHNVRQFLVRLRFPQRIFSDDERLFSKLSALRYSFLYDLSVSSNFDNRFLYVFFEYRLKPQSDLQDL